MEELPPDLTIDILSRLPVKTIFHCKRVCKKWRNLVSDPSFVNLHLSRSPTGLIVHQNDMCQVDPGILKWVEIEDRADHHHLHHDPQMSLDFNTIPIFQNSRISQMGSVDGLICLRQPSRRLANTYICNPVTREMIIIPEYYDRDVTVIAYGFGVSSLTGEYKVVRTFKRKLPLKGNQSYRRRVFEAEVYTLGTGQWRTLGRAPYLLDPTEFGVFLNDHCHWIVLNNGYTLESICTFDLNKETFQLFSFPPCEPIGVSHSHYHSLAVLKSCLCVSVAENFDLTIWVMKEYGIKKSWHKEVVIIEAICPGLEWPELFSLIEGLKDGTILFKSGGLWALDPTSVTIEEIKTFELSESGFTYCPS